jgi:exodeoxyribonuclease VII large subunit
MDPASSPVPGTPPERDIYTVSRLNREVRVLLERGFGTLWIEAEISNFARPSSGHWYFSLKDANAQVRCAMFRQRNYLSTFTPKDGQKVLVRARIGLYEPRGEYQLIVDHIEDAGRRADCDVLILARGGGSLEDLWAFNDERLARAIVASPIPIITGVGHEVDFTIADFAADVRAPTPSAAAELVVPDAQEWLQSFALAGKRLEAALRRRVAELRERLRWLAGRAGVVSPAAKLTQQAQRLDELEQAMVREMKRRLQTSAERLRWLAGRAQLVGPATRLSQQSLRLDACRQRLDRAWRQIVGTRGAALSELARTLNAVSPLATLERGYAIVSTEDGRILRDAADAGPGSIIEARLAVGRVRARVEGTS